MPTNRSRRVVRSPRDAPHTIIATKDTLGSCINDLDEEALDQELKSLGPEIETTLKILGDTTVLASEVLQFKCSV